jgi:hypothetical protein
MALVPWLPLVIALAVVGLLAVVVVLSVRGERKRREALRQVAENFGFDFEPQADQLSSSEFGRFHLFTQGRSRKAENLLRGRFERDEVLIFDYRYVVGSGKNRTTHRQTVAALSLGPRAALPNFELRPENIFHKIGSAFGYQDIDLPDYPSFSSRCLLRGQDESAIRALFDGTVIEAVENAKNICLEGGGPWLVIYRASKRINAPQIPDLLEEVRNLRTVFARRAEVRHA